MKQKDKVAIAENYIIDQLRELQTESSIDIGNGFIAWVQQSYHGYWLIQPPNNKRSIRDDEFESYFDKFKPKDIINVFLNNNKGDYQTIKELIEKYRKGEK
tara:strand:+ start:498 stop:800 length:303 start_codon:yes stop_codon:yes gene_type:complete